MPRPNPPPTPGSSTDIRGKEGVRCVPSVQLPPTAYQESDRASSKSSTSSVDGSDSSYRPVSPSSPMELSKKRPTNQTSPTSPVITKDDFTLPPPPTRSRKIIQMTPKEKETVDGPAQLANTSPQASRTQSIAQPGEKKIPKRGNNTAAGRKIARKTAHSLIERRRRSKMNEEFGVLKDMIPACKGQEMHKLAILQASIDYLRYLEQCVAELKKQNSSQHAQQPIHPAPQFGEQDEDEDEDEDEDMKDDNENDTGTPISVVPTQSSSTVSLPPISHFRSNSTTSPSAFSAGTGRHYSLSSTSQASFSPYFHSNQASPAFGPQLSQIPTEGSYRDTLGLGSPALRPAELAQNLHQITKRPSAESKRSSPGSLNPARSERELDREAMAALLMLNNDRRDWRTSKGSKQGTGQPGMSVRDLLSG